MGERPAKAVRDTLAAAAALSGETIRIGYPTDDPDRGVWCLSSTAMPSTPTLGTLGEEILRPRVQVFVRTKRREYEAATTLAWAVHDAIKRNEPTDYTRAYPVSAPIELQPDEKERPRWSINVELTLIE